MSIYGNPVMLGESGGGGGGVTILSGTDTPSAAQGSNGHLYLKYISSGTTITNIRMVIHAVRNSGSDTQVAEVQLYDANGDAISWGAGTGTSNGTVFTVDQTADKAFDNITTDKWYTDSRPSLQAPIWIDFAPNTPIPANSVKGWGWYTANDSNNRDPKTFDLLLSFDGGNTYVLIDSAIDASITTNRNELAYTKTFNIVDGAIIATYAKVSGAWQDLIGTDINDITLG